MENIIVNKVVVDERGHIIQNDIGEVKCEVIKENGEASFLYFSIESLKECGLISENSQMTNCGFTDVPFTPGPSCSQIGNDLQGKAMNFGESKLWKSSKCPTENDHLATIILLQLRKKMEYEFKDKKTAKNILWGKIAKQMNSMGYYVGAEMNEGREKVRQKFANLQTSYKKYQERRRHTGEGKVEKPQYFTELDEILGEKHNIFPPFVLDSETNASNTFINNPEEVLGSGPAAKLEAELKPQDDKLAANAKAPSRFAHLKTSVRPIKEKVTDVLKEMHQENLSQRKHEFNTMVELMREESKQRHQEVMAAIQAMQKKGKSNKRRRDSEDSLSN